jgi:hypothetical protein
MIARHQRKAYAYEKSFEGKKEHRTPEMIASTLFSVLQPSALAEPPQILCLPTELLQEISSYLPVYSRALLSLTCKNMLYLLGNESWAEPHIADRWNGDHLVAEGTTWETNCRNTFLKTLAKDANNLFFCAECRVLHQNLPAPGDLRLKTQGKSACLIKGGVIDWFPRDENKGYTLVWKHIKKAFDTQEKPSFVNQNLEIEIPTLSYPNLHHTYSIQQMRKLKTTTYTITFGAYYINYNMVLKHEHHFTAAWLTANDVIDFPLRICPHLTTSTASWGGGSRVDPRQPYAHSHYNPKRRVWYVPSQRKGNGPMLTHAINQAFPKHKRHAGTTGERRFREPYAREESQMFEKREPSDFWWCRSCSTKFRVAFGEEGGLKVTVYQNLGENESVAKHNFEFLVRQEKANWEYGSLSRTFPDFDCE